MILEFEQECVTDLQELNSDLGRPKGDVDSKDFLLEAASWFYLQPGPSRPEQTHFSKNHTDLKSRESQPE